MKVCALIPARGGSKSIPKKNLLNIKGYPLIAYSIAAAKLSKAIDRIVVTTDSKEIGEISKKYGAEVPFLRPAEFAQDTSTDKEFLEHAILWFEKNEGKAPDYFVHLRPTTPLRDPEKIDEAVESMLKNPEENALRSAHATTIVPQKLFGLENRRLVMRYPLFATNILLCLRLLTTPRFTRIYVSFYVARYRRTTLRIAFFNSFGRSCRRCRALLFLRRIPVTLITSPT